MVQLRPDDPPAPTLSLAAGLALIEAVDAARPGPAADAEMAQRRAARRHKLAGILLERSGDRVVVGFGVNLASAPACRTARPRPRRRHSAGGLCAAARRQLRAAAGAVAAARVRRLRAPGAARASARYAAHGSRLQRRDGQRHVSTGSSPTGPLRLRSMTARSRSSAPATSSCESNPLRLGRRHAACHRRREYQSRVRARRWRRDQGALADRHRPAANR